MCALGPGLDLKQKSIFTMPDTRVDFFSLLHKHLLKALVRPTSSGAAAKGARLALF
jgi:hypothetical protein